MKGDIGAGPENNIVNAPKLSLRNLKAAISVARHQNVTAAADELNRSQTAVTKALNNLEVPVAKGTFLEMY